MNEIKLDKKDLRVLDQFDRNPNITINQLAKKVGISRQVAEYRVNKLLSQHTIYAFYTLVDVGKLGYSLFRVHIRLKNVTREAYRNFAKELFSLYPSMWVAFVSGSFDLIYDVFAKTPNEFETIFSQIVEKNKEIIQSYETLIALNLSIYQYGYFLNKEQERKKVTFNENTNQLHLDHKDTKILHILKLNSRTPYETIGRKVGLTRNAVKYRIKKLEENGIIVGYTMLINFTHLDKQSFKIFIKYNNQKKEQENSLLQYLKQTPGVLATLQLFGKWDLDVEIHQRNSTELQEFIMELRNKFEIIEDYEIIPIIDDFGIDFFPEKLS